MKKILLTFGLVLGTAAFSTMSAQSSYREPVSASQKSDDGVLVAFPNPAQDFLVVKSKDSSVKIKSIAVYSILGMQVASYTVNANTKEINVEKLKPGKYLLRYVMSDNTQRVTQIIKK